MNILEYKLIYHKGGFILYRKFISKNRIKVNIKLFYMVNLITFYKDEAIYSLNDKVTLNALISSYKAVIDNYNYKTKLSKHNAR